VRAPARSPNARSVSARLWSLTAEDVLRVSNAVSGQMALCGCESG
jgi:hypothetical protein